MRISYFIIVIRISDYKVHRIKIESEKAMQFSKQKDNNNKFALLIIIAVVSILQSVHAQTEIQSFKDGWYTLDQFQGKLYQTHTMFTDPKCNPCSYLLKIYKQQIVLTIISPVNNQIKSFGLKILSSTQQDGFAFDQKSYNLSNNQNIKVAQSLTRFVTDRLSWEYQFTLPYEGIIIKGSYQDNHYITAIFSLFITAFSFALLPLRSNFLKKLTNMIFKRTNMISMIILSQNLHFLLIYYAATTIKYILWQDKILVKFIWYGVFMTTLSILIVHTILFYSTMQKNFNDFSKKNSLSAKTKNVLLMSIFLFGIIIFDIIWLYFSKQIFFYYYFSLGYIVQVGYSIKVKTYPHMPTTLYSFLINISLLTLANLLPMFKFQQTTLFDAIFFLVYCLSIFLIGNLCMKYFIGLQNIVEFQCTGGQHSSNDIDQSGKRNSQMEIVQRET